MVLLTTIVSGKATSHSTSRRTNLGYSKTIVFVSLIGLFAAIAIETIVAAPVPQFAGKYELTSSPGDPAYNDYLIALGVAEPFRKIMTRIHVNLEIQKLAEGKYTYIVQTPILTRASTFTLNQEVEDKYIDGRMFKSVLSLADKETIKQTLDFGNVVGTNLFHFTPDGMTATMKAGDKVVVRTYKRG